MQYVVQIIKFGHSNPEREIPCGQSERQAEKVERRVNINLNHKEYYTMIVGDESQEATP